jgi:hypothetical protein
MLWLREKQACGSENSKKSLGEQKCNPVAKTQVTGHKKTAQKKALKKPRQCSLSRKSPSNAKG